MLGDPPNNLQRSRDDETSEHKWLNVDVMEGMLRLCRAVLKHKGQRDLFYTALGV